MRVDALRQIGLSPLQKCTTALCILAYGLPVDSVDKCVWIGETAAMECLEWFVSNICTKFENEYLKRPDNKDTEWLLQIRAAHEFPVMLGFIVCMHGNGKIVQLHGKVNFVEVIIAT